MPNIAIMISKRTYFSPAAAAISVNFPVPMLLINLKTVMIVIY